MVHREEPELLQWLDLVAIGTVCDVVELRGLNRAFVAQGLSRRQKKLGGAQTAAGVDAGRLSIGVYNRSRINAAGRVGKAELGARLLSCDDEIYAMEVSGLLENQNNRRQQIEGMVLDQALSLVKQDDSADDVIVVAADNWHPGVIGIVAARLREKFNKPTCNISKMILAKDLVGRFCWDSGSAVLGQCNLVC